MKKLLSVFDVKAAIIGGILLGTIVAWVNSGHGTEAAISSGLRQALYSFFVAGLSAQLCRNLTDSRANKMLTIVKAVLVPTMLTVSLVYIMHSTRGTPEPFFSSIPVAILSLISFSVIALHALREKGNHQQADAG
jgi:Kef-type K+ transport system membrane component KefB